MCGMDDRSLLDKYVSRVLELQKESRQNIRDLDSIAGELGLSEAELREIRSQVGASLTRSRQYLKSGMYADAVTEATKAHELSPWDADIASLLGSIYEAWSRGSLFPSKLHRQAEYWYKAAVNIDAKHERAFIGLQSLAKARQARLRTRLALAIIFIAGFYLIGMIFSGKGKTEPASSGKEAELPGGGAGTVESPRGNAEHGLPDSETVPVLTEFDLSADGAGFEVQASSLRRYSSGKNSYSCDIRGLLRVESKEIYKLSIKAVWYDKDARKFLEKTVSVVNSYSAPLKSGEVLPLRILEYSEGEAPPLSKVLLSIAELDADTSSTASSGKSLAVIWKTARAEGMSIEAYLRSQSTANGSKDYVVKTVLVVKNTGQSRIQFVSMRPVFRRNGTVVKTGTERILLMRDNGFLPPGEKFPFQIGRAHV